MSKLTAQFSVNPNYPLIVECKDGEQFSYSFSDEEYDIDIKLPVLEGGPRSGVVGSDVFKRLVEKVEIIITKEVGDIPPITLTENGEKDYFLVSSFFDGLKENYSNVAQSYYKKLIKYIKFELKQPFQNDELINKDQLNNPSWRDNIGNDYGVVGFIHHVQRIPGLDGKTLGVKTLKMNHDLAIRNYMNSESNIELFQEILSDAQAAIFSGDSRRAIFEMAITCELAIKRTYSSADTFSARAFDYFEDKSLLNVPLIDYIHKVAQSVFGESFKDHSSADYKNIEYLISCRNKVAHRGTTTFKYNKDTITPDKKMIEDWYASVRVLLSWLELRE